MSLKWRFTGGILFSSTLHVLLLSALLFWYPGIINRNIWPWQDWSPFFADETIFSADETGFSRDAAGHNFNADIIFPDIVLSTPQKGIRKKTKNKIKIAEPKISLQGILAQVEKYPARLQAGDVQKKEFSSRLGTLLAMLKPVPRPKKAVKKKLPGFNLVDLKKYRQDLNLFLSKRWEVPIHLIESQLAVVIQFEINKDGRIISWVQEESDNTVLFKSVKKLLKNLNYFPALPKSYLEESYKFGVRFTPANFRK